MKKLKGTLTNKEIDHYVLSGHYGPARKREWIRGIRRGTIRTNTKAIRAGHYGSEAQEALASRKHKRTTKPKTTQQSTLSALDDFLAGLS